MREAGADMKAVSAMMGHEGILLTLKTYTDASREFKNREIAVLKDYYENAVWGTKAYHQTYHYLRLKIADLGES